MQSITILAAEPLKNPALPDTYSSGEGVNFISELVSKGIGLTFVIGAIVFIFMIIWGAVQWIISGGDKNAVQSAQGRITHAIIGLIVLLSSYAILKVIGSFFGIEVFQKFTIDIGPLIISI